jgi:molecular chaperone GrpE (heat shock protein)
MEKTAASVKAEADAISELLGKQTAALTESYKAIDAAIQSERGTSEKALRKIREFALQKGLELTQLLDSIEAKEAECRASIASVRLTSRCRRKRNF